MKLDTHPLTDAELAQYASRTSTRPLLCFAALAALPFVQELICRLVEQFQ